MIQEKDWETREAERQALLAIMEPLDALIDGEATMTALQTVLAQLPIEERDLRDRLWRIEIVLNNDLPPVMARLESLRNPIPDPASLNFGAPGESPAPVGDEGSEGAVS